MEGSDQSGLDWSVAVAIGIGIIGLMIVILALVLFLRLHGSNSVPQANVQSSQQSEEFNINDESHDSHAIANSNLNGESLQTEPSTTSNANKTQPDEISNGVVHDSSPPIEKAVAHSEKVLASRELIPRGLPDDTSSKSFESVNPLAKSSERGDVVFVIDKSSSMSGKPFLRVVRALKEAIDLLDENQSFTVVFFDDFFTAYHEHNGLIKATAENKAMVLRWVDTVLPSGGTSVLSAMLQALQYDADKVIVLSDGEFDPIEVIKITATNRRKKSPAVIDCVGLTEWAQTLRQLAHDNRGVFYQTR